MKNPIFREKRWGKQNTWRVVHSLILPRRLYRMNSVGRSPGSRLWNSIRLPDLWHEIVTDVKYAAYSCGAASELNGIPFSWRFAAPHQHLLCERANNGWQYSRIQLLKQESQKYFWNKFLKSANPTWYQTLDVVKRSRLTRLDFLCLSLCSSEHSHFCKTCLFFLRFLGK